MDLKYCCFFCYKNVDEHELNKKEDKEQVLTKFKMLVHQYFVTSQNQAPMQQESHSQDKLNSCPGCLTIITSFCDLYQELKFLELQVEERLSKLKNVMVLADAKGVGGDRDGIRHHLYRKELITKCNSLPTLSSLPKVFLAKTQRKRIRPEENLSVSSNPQSQSALSFTGMMLDFVLVPDDQLLNSRPSSGNTDDMRVPVITNDRGTSPATQLTTSSSPPLTSMEDLNSSASAVPVQMEVMRAPCAPIPERPEIKCVTTTFVDPSIIAIKVDLREEEESRMEVDIDIPPPENQKVELNQNHLLSTVENGVLEKNEPSSLPPSPSSTPLPTSPPPPGTSSPPPSASRTLRPRKKVTNIAEKDSESDDDNKDDDYVPEEVDVDSEDEAEIRAEPEALQKTEEPTKLPPPPPLFLKSFDSWIPPKEMKKTARKLKPWETPTQINTSDEKKKKVKCRHCSRKFVFKKERKAHEKLHGHFPCSNTTCDFTTKYAPTLAEHELLHLHDDKEEKDADNSASAKKKPKKGFSSIRCPRCPPPPLSPLLGRKKRYIEHFLEVHLNLKLSHQCPICEVTFGDKDYARTREKHIKIHHNIEGMDPSSVLHCKECPAYFRRHMQLFLHNRKAHNGSLLKCKDCGSKLIDMTSYRKHRIRVHKLEPSDFPFVCEISPCEERAETEMELQFHYNSVHGNRNEGGRPLEKLVCDECGKEFKGYCGFKSHMKTHSPEYLAGLEAARKAKKEERFICDECGKVFDRKDALETHKSVVHLGPEHFKFECDVCEKKCYSKSKLDEHKRVHGKEKPFVCDVCGGSYAHAHNLRIHKSKAHGDNDNDAGKRRRGGKKRKLEEVEVEEEEEDYDDDED
ncbi:unnamed protein product [Orchesella dallaii]|uniref:C2H2-type domain-containing protein n=1 Tax=Orchesella dallaii TaxID=48710 RepID=A0ABP1QGR4_9HEXA